MKKILVSILVAAVTWGCAAQNYEPPQTLKAGNRGLVFENTLVTGVDKRPTDGWVFYNNRDSIRISKNRQLLLNQVKEAARNDDRHALTLLGHYYLEGEMGFPKDEETAFRYFKRAADNDDYFAKQKLAWIYYNGSITKKDCKTAEKLAAEIYKKYQNDSMKSLYEEIKLCK